MGQPFSHGLRVRYGECDAQGVVFNANYLAYFDTNTNELLRAALGSYNVMLERGVDIVVAEAQLRFRAPARFEDELRLEIAVTRFGTTSITTGHWIGRDDELLVEGLVRYVTVDPDVMKKAPIPEWLRDSLAPWTVEEGDPWEPVGDAG